VSMPPLTDEEEQELYVLMKPREERLTAALAALLRRLENALYARLTIEELEGLAARFDAGR
jgi:hypothetical protein